MSRFGPDPHAFFDAVYQGTAPWDIGGVGVDLVERAIERFGATAGWRVLHVAPAEFVNTVAAPTPAIVACIERS